MQAEFHQTESVSQICRFMMDKWIAKMPEKLHLQANGSTIISPKKFNATEFSEFRHTSTIALYLLRRIRTNFGSMDQISISSLHQDEGLKTKLQKDIVFLEFFALNNINNVLLKKAGVVPILVEMIAALNKS